MGEQKIVQHNGLEVKIEQVEADEIRTIASKNKGSFDSDFGVYFFITNKDNHQRFIQGFGKKDYHSKFIGQAGIVKGSYEEDGQLIYSGPELCDLDVMPKHQRKGYATLLTELRLQWLKEKGLSKAYFLDCKKPKPVIRLFEKLQEKKY